MTKIKSLNPGWANRAIIMPIVGKVEFNDKCITEVKDAKVAKELVAIESLKLELVGSGGSRGNKAVKDMNKSELVAKVVEMNRDGGEDLSDKNKGELVAIIEMSEEDFAALTEEVEEVVEDEETEDDTPLSKEEKIEYINSLDKMSELKELAAGFPEGEWKSINSKAKLKDYLIKNVD